MFPADPDEAGLFEVPGLSLSAGRAHGAVAGEPAAADEHLGGPAGQPGLEPGRAVVCRTEADDAVIVRGLGPLRRGHGEVSQYPVGAGVQGQIGPGLVAVFLFQGLTVQEAFRFQVRFAAERAEERKREAVAAGPGGLAQAQQDDAHLISSVNSGNRQPALPGSRPPATPGSHFPDGCRPPGRFHQLYGGCAQTYRSRSNQGR